MRVFVTGASGCPGTAVVRALSDAGHPLQGLVRSAAGAEPLRVTGGDGPPGLPHDFRDGVHVARP